MKKETEIELNVIETRLLMKVCHNLDGELYYPMKERLEREKIVHPLGILKEDFKNYMCQRINESFKEIKSLIDKEMEKRAKDIIALISKARLEAEFRLQESKTSAERNAHRGAEYAFESLIKELQK